MQDGDRPRLDGRRGGAPARRGARARRACVTDDRAAAGQARALRRGGGARSRTRCASRPPARRRRCCTRPRRRWPRTAATRESAERGGPARARQRRGGRAAGSGTRAARRRLGRAGALARRSPTRAWAIVDEALAALAGAEYVLYSAPLYALGAWAQVDRALRARALRRDADVDARAAALAGARFDARLVAGAPPEPAAHRAQLDAELGRLDDPPDAGAWEAAGRRWERARLPLPAAVCAWREAEALLAGGDRARAARSC